MNVMKFMVRTASALVVAGVGWTAVADETATSAGTNEQTPIVSSAKTATETPATANTDKTSLAIPDSAAPAVSDSSSETVKVEPIVERYPNGKVKIERQVAQDAAGNFINHGKYTMYDLDGTVLKTGSFHSGKLSGEWTQHFAKDEGHLFSGGLEKEFDGPFTSTATFSDGQLSGTWTIKDSKGQNVVEWNFDHSVRNGKWTWWYPTGDKRLEATYDNGALNGDVVEYEAGGKEHSRNTYIDGRCLVKTTGWYALGQKRFEGYYLRVASVPASNYDWWTSTVTAGTPVAKGEDLKHGQWTEWYRSGAKKGEGQFSHNLPIGQFTYWYENGQKQGEGGYLNGLMHGTWITWHPNGMKESQGDYRDGRLVTKWQHWDAEGKLVEARDAQQPQQQTQQQPTPATRNTAQRQYGYPQQTR